MLMAANPVSRGAIALVLLLAIAWTCTPSAAGRSNASSPTTTHLSTAPAPTFGALGAAGCRPLSPSGAFTGEVYGTATGGTVWAWFMAGYPPRAGIEDKTLWRLNGPSASGVPSFDLVGPASERGHLNWGPSLHESSTWSRPGSEFGTGLLFPTAGCWDVHVRVGLLTGDVYVVVT